MKTSFILELFHDFLSLFYPRYCSGCSDILVKGEEVICTRCILELSQTDHPTDHDNSLKKRLSVRVPLRFAMAFLKFSKKGRIQKLLHALKYKNQPEVAVMLGRVFGERLRVKNYVSVFDIIIPVPLHSSRLRKRGYNQSAKFAEGLSERLGIPVECNAVDRSVKTATQTRKTKLNRWENVENVFVVRDPARIKGKRILLVDDVITTGATIEACGEVLLKHECAELSIACIAEA